MKKLSNKGFTLVELMAVIVILAIIIGIAIPASLSISHKIRVNMCNKKITMLESAAKLYKEDNPSETSVTVEKLVQEGYVKKDDKTTGDVINPIDSSSMKNERITLGKTNKRYTASFNNKDTVCNK